MTHASPIHAHSIGDAATPRSRPHPLTRRRYQVGGGILAAVVLPLVLHPGFNWTQPHLVNYSAVGTLVALLFGWYLFRRMTAFPGVGQLATLVPAFAVSYGCVLLFFFLARMDYTRSQFVASFAIAVVWFAVIGIADRRLRRPRLYVVPFGQAETLLANPGVDWVVSQGYGQELPADIGGVVADFEMNMRPEWQRVLANAALDGIPVYHWKQIAESLTGTVSIERLSENNLGSLLPSSIYLRFKRVMDLVGAIVALPFAVLIILVAGVAIRLEDRGPVFFRQRRTGFRGRPFTMLKLRSMRADQRNGSPFTLPDDPRITRVGRFLRRYRLDEVPQVFNILVGDMSWIGPRPESIALAQWYEREVPFYSYRHIVRPGITGWAQTNQGNVAEVGAATSKLRYDFYYIKYLSPWLDTVIIFRTIRTVLTGFGVR